MNNPKVSVIVPVYNTPFDYLERCIGSITDQTYSNVEILIIDDGSTKEIFNKCDMFESAYSNVSVFHKDNEGVSSARNYGLKKMTGSFCMFVDPDDELIDNSVIEKAIELASETGADFICARVTYEFESCSCDNPFIFSEYYKEIKDKQIDKLAAYFGSFLYSEGSAFPSTIPRGPVAKLYKSNLAKSIKFDKRLSYAEDGIYNYLYVKKIKTAVLVDESWYKYYQYKHSAVHSSKLDSFAEHCLYVEDYFSSESQLYWGHRFHILKEVLFTELRGRSGIRSLLVFLKSAWCAETLDMIDTDYYELTKVDWLLLVLLKCHFYFVTILGLYLVIRFKDLFSKKLIG